MNIVIIGNVCLDKNTTEKSSYQSAGSPAMFMTRIFAQLSNTSSTIISHYGKDFLADLKGKSIYPTGPKFSKTLVYHNISQNDGKRIQKAFNRKNSPPVELDESLNEIVKNADILFFTPLLPNFPPKYTRGVISNAKKDCLKILSPQGYFRNFNKENKVVLREFEEAQEVIPHFDFTILSEEDYPDIENIAKTWVKNNNSVVIITKAERGAAFLSETEKVEVPTKPVKKKDIVDSTGSGDIFCACFAYKYLKCKDIIKSIEFAHTVAGYCLKFTPEEIQLKDILISDNLTEAI